ncbi:hypothetical protein KAR91_01475 [Candidatus Pacearchaeota archaeon]|nr:hypothetical protein [Candidatus Pacearchaeota archaeon]
MAAKNKKKRKIPVKKTSKKSVSKKNTDKALSTIPKLPETTNRKSKLGIKEKKIFRDYLSDMSSIIKDNKLTIDQRIYLISRLLPETNHISNRELSDITGINERQIYRFQKDPFMIGFIKVYSADYVYSRFVEIIDVLNADILNIEGLEASDRARAARALVKVADHLNPTAAQKTPGGFTLNQTFIDNPNAAIPTMRMTEDAKLIEATEHMEAMGYEVTKVK